MEGSHLNVFILLNVTGNGTSVERGEGPWRKSILFWRISTSSNIAIGQVQGKVQNLQHLLLSHHAGRQTQRVRRMPNVSCSTKRAVKLKSGISLPAGSIILQLSFRIKFRRSNIWGIDCIYILTSPTCLDFQQYSHHASYEHKRLWLLPSKTQVLSPLKWGFKSLHRAASFSLSETFTFSTQHE